MEGHIDELSILRCVFSQNKAKKFGGALNIFNESNFINFSFSITQGVKTPILIYQSIFLDNQAEIGGAIYIGNQDMSISMSSFHSNYAYYGAAIGQLSDGNIWFLLFIFF